MKSSKSYLPQKLLAMALSLALAVTMMIPSSLAVYAAEGDEPETQVTAALPDAVDGTITLTGDVELSETAAIASDTTLDLAGYKVSGPSTAVDASQGGILTVIDSSETQTGKITVSGDYAAAVSGSVVLESGTIEANGKMAYGINVPRNGSVAINGGKVSVSGAEAIAVNLPKGSSAEMNGGTINADYSGSEGVYGVYVAGASVAFTMNKGDIVVNGSGSKAIQLSGNNSKAIINGGTISVSGSESIGVCSSPFMPSQIDVNGGSISASGSRANAVFADENSTLNIAGGTLNSETSSAVSIYKNTTTTVTGGTITGGTYGVQIGNIAQNTITVSEEAKKNISGEKAAFNAALIKDPETGAYVVTSGEFVLMNIPYDKFYEAEGVSGVDAVTSATVKTYNQNMAGGSYHTGSLAATDPDTDDPISGAKIQGVTYPVFVEDSSVLEGKTEVTDESKATISVASGKSARVTKEVSGKDVLFASGDYAYYVMANDPANYKTLKVGEDGAFSFSEVKNGAVEKEASKAALTYGGHYTDLTLSFAAEEIGNDAVVSGVIITAGGSKYALRHVEDVWRKTELGWNWTGLDGAGLAGKTITNITYYLQDGGVYSYDVEIAVKKNPGKDVAAEFKDANTVTVTGLPEDIENAKAKVASKVGRGQTPVVIADGVDVKNGTITTTSAAESLTDYTVTIMSDNYGDVSVTAKYDNSAYVLMNIPYDKFYEAEGVSGVDTVTSATVKTYNQNMAGGSYHSGSLNVTDPDTDDPLDKAEILGITYPVFVKDLSALKDQTEVTDESKATITVASGKSARTTKDVTGTDVLFASGDYAYYVMNTVPEVYKTLSVDGENKTFSKVSAEAVKAEFTSTAVSYGGHYTDIEFKVEDAEHINGKVNAIILTAGDGKYALRHVEDIWRMTDLGWSKTSLDGKGLQGKTITNVTYYVTSSEGAYGIYSYDTDAYIKPYSDAEISAAFENSSSITVTGLPEDAKNPVAKVAPGGRDAVAIAENVPVKDGKISISGEPVVGTKYNVVIATDNYADFSAVAEYSNDIAAAEAAAAADAVKADAAKINSTDYTADSYKAVEDALNALDAAIAAKDPDAIKSATEALNTAVASAEPKSETTIKVKPTKKTYKVKTLKKKTKKFSLKATVSSKAKATFKKVSGNKKITVSKAGKVTVKKKLKKGTYKVKVRVTAPATANAKAATKTVTLVIKVKK